MQFKYLLFISAALFLAGCSKVLDVQPRDQFTASDLFETKPGFYSASAAIYDGMASTDLYGRQMTYEMMDLIGKRYKMSAHNTVYQFLINHGYTVLVPLMFDRTWTKSYKLILQSNMLMDHISRQEGVLTQVEADILQGEMLTARAFLHFDMLRLFGPRWENNAATLSIPYQDQPKTETRPLLSFETVIEKIISDLDKAETLLAKDPVINQGPLASAPSGATESIQLRFRQFRFNYFATIALKARVYLYAGKKPEALATAKRLLADPKLQQHFPPVDPQKELNNHINPDRVFSSEVLTGSYVQNRDLVFQTYFNSDSATLKDFLQPYPGFLDRLFAFGGSTGAKEYEDYRYKLHWEPASVGGHMLTKYKPITQPAGSEYFYSKMIPLIRLSEVYYIAAESEPNPVDGFAWLNQMRPRRGLTPIDPSEFSSLAANFPALLANEYLREFYGEGQAFFFFKRTAYRQVYENGVALAVVNYSDAAYRPPLPESERTYHE
jgi:starch-binding outer membrane protein, SusD/RagB family